MVNQVRQLSRVRRRISSEMNVIAEAREHVLRFDWSDVARRTAAVYGELARPVSVA